MAIGEICSREVVVAFEKDSVADAARLMRKHHVGSIVVVRDPGGKRVPIGMLTDRDIAVGVVALGLDPESTGVIDAMGPELFVMREDAGVAEAAALMRARGVRRLPVVAADGRLVGLIAADDLIDLLAEELACVAGTVAREREREAIQRRENAQGRRSHPEYGVRQPASAGVAPDQLPHASGQCRLPQEAASAAPSS